MSILSHTAYASLFVKFFFNNNINSNNYKAVFNDYYYYNYDDNDNFHDSCLVYNYN